MSKKGKPKTEENQVMLKIASFIVDKRNLFFLLFILSAIFSMVSMNWVNVENDISAYLSKDTETRRGLERMEKEFVTFETARVMVQNISLDQAEAIADYMETVEGVSSVTFEDSEEHYKQASALFDLTFDYEEGDARNKEALQQILDKYEGYDVYVSSTITDSISDIIAEEIRFVLVIAAVIIVAVLLLTSQTYAEVPVLLITFMAAALLNMGTNFLFGTISFVSNSVTVVLQLALAIDYAVILVHRYTEERERYDAHDATVIALSKGIPEIASSSLTTIGGLGAMMFMQFHIGFDMGICLIKAILYSLLSVFALMPGLLMVFSKWIDRTHHRNFVPKITPVGKFAVKSRFVIPPVFAVMLIAVFIFSNNCPYVYGTEDIKTFQKNDVTAAKETIEDTFGSSNMVALIVPGGDYDAEADLLADLEACDEVDHALGLANTEVMDGYTLTDGLTPRAFSELLDLDYAAAEALYAAYAASEEDYGRIVNDLDNYEVPIIDMVMYLYDMMEDGYIKLDDDLEETFQDLYDQLYQARQQLQSQDYSRMLVYLNLPVGGEETFQFLDRIHVMADKYYDGGDVLLAGNSPSQYDLSKSFANDNLMISIVSALIVMVVLLLTFRSAGLPVLLILVIEGSIWTNFSFPYLTDTKLFFMSYLVVSSIQMGANIDYAIVISSRFSALKKEMNAKDAMVETLNQAFPTIITSGAILAFAGALIGVMTSEATISSIGVCLGRGTLISLILVMFVLPQILLLGDTIIERTSFNISVPVKRKRAAGYLFVDGIIRGEIHGSINASVRGVVQGDVNAAVISGTMEEVSEEAQEGGAEHAEEEKNQ